MIEKKRKIAYLRRDADGTITALSSDRSDVYYITLSPDSCSCPAGQRGIVCYHLTQARERYQSVPAEPAVVDPDWRFEVCTCSEAFDVPDLDCPYHGAKRS